MEMYKVELRICGNVLSQVKVMWKLTFRVKGRRYIANQGVQGCTITFLIAKCR